MGRIAVLTEAIASKIAAGEVVERPASAVKELVENAIDAGARSIEVELRSGGRDLIRVSDDGDGMGPDDLLLALERHATSKIRSDSDIESVSSLGFRGEAIPAIASVSRFTMASRDTESEVATEVEVHGGRLVAVREISAPRGTRVDVASLFYNAPARRKFLRSADVERQKAVELLSRFAVAYPEIRFRLSADGRAVFDYAPVFDAVERCAQVFGRQTTSRMLRIEGAAGPLAVSGLCSGVEETRAHTRDQHLYVNRRPVRDRLLSHATGAVYAEVLPRGRHPILILLLSVPPDCVDVNVHPAKAEVRFRRPGEVHEFLTRILAETLRRSGAGATVRLSGPTPPPPSQDGSWRYSPGGFPAAGEPGPGIGPAAAVPAFGDTPLVPFSSSPQAPSERSERSAPTDLQELEPWTGTSDPCDRGRFDSAGPPRDESGRLARPAGLQPGLPGPGPAPVPLGQFLESYILAANGDELVLVDQHAAHERILFEKIRRRMGTPSSIPSQRLLTPCSVEIPPSDRERVPEAIEALSSAGFEIEAFGPGAVLVRALPAGFEEADPARLIREVLSDLQEGPPGVPAARAREIAASVACHAAIKVRFPLTRSKMVWLLEELARCEAPASCPHGRPTTLRIGLVDLERAFHRR